MTKKISLFIAAFFIWCLLNWVPDWEHMVVGVFAAAFVTFINQDLFMAGSPAWMHPRRYFTFLFYYLPVFFWQMILASLRVGYGILHPSLAIHPGIVKVKTSLKSDVALTFLANTITLTGATMTVDIDKEAGVLYVHWIDVKTKDIEQATKMIVERFEKILAKIFEPTGDKA